MKLYGISESMVRDILTNMHLSHGQHIIINQIEKFIYPVKMVVSVEGSIITVVTAYPLKKGRNP